MRMQITNAEGRVYTLHKEYCIALKSAGFGRSHVEKPQIAIEELLGKHKSYALQKRTVGIIKW